MTPAPQLIALERRRPGTFTVLIAATCLLMLLAAALVLALRAAARTTADAAARRVIVQIVEANPDRRDALAAEAISRLGRTPGVIVAEQMPEEQARALVEPYIGGMSGITLPLPVLIEVRADGPMPVTRAVSSLPGVQITSIGAELNPLLRLIDALRSVGFGVAMAAAVATGLIAMLSARAALARESETLAILHSLGATDRQLSRLVTGKIARDAAIQSIFRASLSASTVSKRRAHAPSAAPGWVFPLPASLSNSRGEPSGQRASWDRVVPFSSPSRSRIDPIFMQFPYSRVVRLT